MKTRSIAFLKIGSFSHTNQATLKILRAHFPDHQVDVIDVGELIKSDPIAFSGGLIALVIAYGPSVLFRKGARWRAFFGTASSFRTIGHKLRRHLASRHDAFTFQTQSLFDGSQPGIPHFVYTDHTALMNRHYEGGQDAIEAHISDRWLDLEANIYENATRVLTQTHRAARSVIEDYGVDSTRVACVFAGGNVIAPASSAPKDYSGKRILYVGTSWERKGGPELLQAFEHVLERHPDAELTLIGPTPELHAPNVRTVGVIPLEELGAYLERATLFCVPTRREPLGFVFIEAADHRLPIVATRVGSLPEIVVEGESGRLVDVGDIDALVDALCELLEDPEKCRTFGERGHAHLAETYSWENVARCLVAEIRSALE